MSVSAAEIVGFWRDAGPMRWFAHDGAFDADIRVRYEAAHMAASRGDYSTWAATAEGALALVLLLDQFPRNLYRGSAHAFATDPMARTVTARAIAQGFDRSVAPLLRPFFYMPFEHSEDRADQQRTLELFAGLLKETGDEQNMRYAKLHAGLIERFGRFPHRNAALGRDTTPDEQAYLDGGGFAG